MGWEAETTAAVIFLAGAFGITIPFLPCVERVKRIESIGEAHTGGLFLGLAFLHVLPDGVENWDDAGTGDYPFAMLIMCLSFILLEAMDRLRIVITSSKEPVLQFPKWVSYLLSAFFVCVSPVTILVVANIHVKEDPLSVGIIQSLAAGTFMYLSYESTAHLRGESNLHDHDVTKAASIGQAICSFVFLSIHSIMDGMVVATAGSTTDMWVLCFAIAFHKLWVALALGFTLKRNTQNMNVKYEGKQLSDPASAELSNNLLGKEETRTSMTKRPRNYGTIQDNEMQIISSKKVDLELPCEDHMCTSKEGQSMGKEYTAFMLGFGIMAIVAAVV
eukprot:CAMPEP_0167760134 /NCGR_PEP_ID=MMETSP0110_2-20121227/11419_1 /TAXON_ID=629695 /ORGANISM="Gymnochlora sp., Strain CCMP2014" /LENGTH=331 /DNA_ID=CAMNT_0007646615 /DNA_START=76 /DNA_END=1071 /DNA_ORIENTATION=-